MATVRPPNALRDRLEALPDEERFEYLNSLRDQNDNTEFADLVRWGLEEVKQATIGFMCSLPSPQIDTTSASMLCAGRIQALELFQTLVFGRFQPEESVSE